MEQGKIRVLIVDDSALMREAINHILQQESSIEVVGIARDGKEAVEKALALKPNVITMDLKMPMMSGLEAIAEIMEKNPTPIIVVSTADTKVVVKALSIGAMDFVTVTGEVETIASELLDKVRIVSRVKALRHYRIKTLTSADPKRGLGKAAPKVVALGISTGGPQALAVVLSKLPRDFSAAVLVVQHMSKGFITGLAEWLNTSSRLEVRVARAGDVLTSGVVYLAPDDYNMYIDKDNTIALKEPTGKSGFHIPSINVMMKSVAEVYGQNAIGVIMTGMGSDGVEGMRAIKDAGGVTIAQDQESSVIFGMNKCAVDNGCVDKEVPLDKIADELVNSI